MTALFQRRLGFRKSPEGRTLLFAGDTPMNYIVFRPVYELLKSDPRLEIFFSSHRDDFSETRRMFETMGVDEKAIVEPRIAARTRYDLFLTPIRICLGRRARVRVKTVHGVSFKGKNFHRAFKDFHYVLCPGPFLKSVYEANRFDRDDSRLVVSGFPKVDALVDGSLDREALMRHYRLDPDRPTILYAPTWGEGNSLNAWGEELIRTLAARPVNLLVKLHDHERAWLERLRPLASSRVRLIEEFDSTPFLFLADLLVSDASSTANEFTLLDRPIVICEVPGLLERYPRHCYDLEWVRGMARYAANVGELGRAVDEGLARPEVGSEMRRRAARELFFRPGASAVFTADLIYRWLKLPPPA